MYIKAGKVILDDQVKENVYLEVTEGRFGQVVDQVETGAEVVDYSEAIIAPGFVETHIHGYQSYDVMDNDAEGLKVMSEALLATGVTSWLPTTLTSSAELLEQVCQTIGQNYQAMPGAKIQGIFLEGPFFTEKYKGAQNPKYMGDPSTDLLDRWNQASGGLVKKIAIAAERSGVEAFIRHANAQGIRVALAHSDATYQEASAAVEAGATTFIHTFNGMSGLHHREPGMVGAALELDNVFAEIICDGHHVHPAAARIVKKCRGVEETVLITDCMRAGGLGEGESRLGEFEVVVANGTARLKSNGSLAGSILDMDQAVRNVVNWGMATPEEALRMASLTPARSVGLDQVCGRIAPGYAADFVVLAQDLSLQATYLNGQLRYKA
ncbi:N-acetylglucosamine-6-phosphate deacetylase [Vaginisenegalia massiliensis]|uniref:N-acetylglucosamine-6-phosphate deacetylase n=1 Tax=Vaginisenegalia massiliensis TaxID=2058294 RepID=UPI000F53D4B3|nr:N-acetylglucosamine-6-phosphate deacetylase [Vaginisenegalia massiliensis]